MGWVTDDQLQRAREVPVLDYMLANEYGNYKLVGREYRHKEHPSLAVGENGWYWHSKSIGSWSALDYLVEVHGYGLVEAVCTVLGEKPQEHPYSQQYKQPKQPKQAEIISTNKYTSLPAQATAVWNAWSWFKSSKLSMMCGQISSGHDWPLDNSMQYLQFRCLYL